MGLDDFVTSYLETALWSSTDDDGDPLDDNFGIEDLDDSVVRQAIEDCDAFRSSNADTLARLKHSDSQVAHDFWLTRNRHGAGFWDGDYPEPHATTLTDCSHAYGSVYLYVGDDGKVYGS